MKRFFNIGYFYFDQKKNQYICLPTGIECKTIEDCRKEVERKMGANVDFRNINVSQFEIIPGKSPQFIASWPMDELLDRNSLVLE